MLRVPPFARTLVGHSGVPVEPHDLLTAWRVDPRIVVPLVAVGFVYARGWRPPDGRRGWWSFMAGLILIAIALVSPIEAAAGVLVSAHMVQHLLLVGLAAPLLAVSAPGPALLRGTPVAARRSFVAARRRLRVDVVWIRRFRRPTVRWVLFVVTFWTWHASLLYGAAVEQPIVHAAEHVTFLATALLVWSSILGRPAVRLPPLLGVIAVFGLALQSVLLAALMTFAPAPWYEPYASPAPGWGLDPLADQQLAGVIMWVPSGLVYAAIGIALVARALHADGRGVPDRA